MEAQEETNEIILHSSKYPNTSDSGISVSDLIAGNNITLRNVESETSLSLSRGEDDTSSSIDIGAHQLHHSQLPILSPKEVVKCKATSIHPMQLRKCQTKLQQLYNKLVLPQSTLNKERTAQTFDDFDTELRTESTDTSLTLDHLFYEDKGKIPKRILIEGQPGYGKSALCAKIVYDWAHDEEYTKKFNLVFIVILQKLENNSIEDVISNYTELCSKTIHNLLIENEEKTLLVLDGFDELPQNNRSSILLMLYQMKYKRTTVVVTCRTGMFKLSVNDRDELLRNSIQAKDFSDRHFHITGIRDKEKFLQKFLSTKHVSPVLAILNEHFSGMTSSPLYLILLAVNVQKSRYNDYTSKTEFYKFLFTFLVMRHLQKKQGKDEILNLFNFIEPLSEFHIALREFGKLALHQITQENLQFECNELTTKVYSLALLVNAKRFYEPYHRSLVEFAAAYYVALECFKSEKISKPIADLLVQLNESSLFLPFLVGLLQKQATQLFLQMKTNAYWLQANENILWTILVECLPVYETISTLYPAVAPFIPSWIHLDSTKLEMLYSSILFQELLKSAIKDGIINRISLSNLLVFQFPSDVVVPELVIRISPDPTSDVTSYKNIQCRKLHFIFEDNFENSDENEESLRQYFKLFVSIRAEHYTLSLTGSPTCKAFVKFLDQEGAPYKTLHHINVKLNNQPEDTTIYKLLEKNVVLSLKLDLNTCFDVKQILNAVAMASSLNSISITSLDEEAVITVDLFQLTESGTREYARLQLQNCIVTWSGTLDNVTCFRSLSLHNCQLENSIAAIQPEILHCKASQLFLQPNYKNLQELILQVDNKCCDPNIWKTCKTLQILGLSFDETVNRDFIKNISNWILQLPIKRLILESNLEKYDPRIILINYLLEKWTKKQKRGKISVFDSVDFIFSRLVDDDDVQVANFSLAVSDLLFALQKKYIGSVNVVCSSNIWKLILQEKFIDESVFCLSHYYYGRRGEDMHDKLLSKLDSFCIKIISGNTVKDLEPCLGKIIENKYFPTFTTRRKRRRRPTAPRESIIKSEETVVFKKLPYDDTSSIDLKASTTKCEDVDTSSIDIAEEMGETNPPIYISNIRYTVNPPIYIPNIYHAENVLIGNVTNVTEASTSRGEGVNSFLFDLEHWQKILKDHYTKVCLPSTPFINDGESQLISKFFTSLELECCKEITEMEKIFEMIEGEQAKRILIEGQPGFGKTAFSLKLIYDWAQEADYMKQFHLAFFIPLRQLRNMELCDAIENNMRKINKDYEFNAKRVMSMKTTNILLIFDGLNELSSENRTPILKILYKQKYRDKTVVVTCRTGTFKLQREEGKLFDKYQKKEFWDKYVTVLGLSEKKRKEFFLKTYSGKNPEIESYYLFPKVDKTQKKFQELFSSPLFAIMLSYLVLEGCDSDSVFSSKTELFKKLFNCIVKNYLHKKGKTVEKNFDLFTVEDTLTDLQNTLKKFGDLAIENLVEKNLMFESKWETNKMYDMGFLIKHGNIFHFTTEAYFEAFHSSIAEFVAAFSAFVKVKLTKEESKKSEMLRQYVDLCFYKGNLSLFNTSLFFPFLVGLLQDEVWLLFSQFKSYSIWFEQENDFFCSLLSEITPVNVAYHKLLPEIGSITPSFIYQRNPIYQNLYMNELYQKVIENGLKEKKITRFVLGNYCKHKIPPNVDLDLAEIIYFVQPQPKWKDQDWMTQKCQRFYLIFDSRCHDNQFQPYIRLLTSIPAYELYVSLSGSGAYTSLEVELGNLKKQGTLQPIEIEYLYCEFNCQKEINCIEEFLKLCKVKRIRVTVLSDELNINQLIVSISKSEQIMCAVFQGECEIDFAELSKSCATIMTFNCKLKLDKAIENHSSISNLLISDKPELKNASIVKQFKPSVLHCDDHLLIDLSELNGRWIGYESVEVLHIWKGVVSNGSLWESLTNFEKVTELMLTVYPSSEETDFEIIVKCIGRLPLKDLILELVDHDIYQFNRRLIECLIKTWQKNAKGPFLYSVTLVTKLAGDESIFIIDEFCSTLSILLNALCQNFLKNVVIESFNLHLWSVVIERKLIDHALFHVQHSFAPPPRKSDISYLLKIDYFRKKTLIKLKE